MKLINTKVLFILVLSFIFGAISNRSFDSNVKNIVSTEKNIEEKSKIREKVLQIIKLKGIDNENREADIIKIFLAYLGIKIENENLRRLLKKTPKLSKMLNQKEIEDNRTTQEKFDSKEREPFIRSNSHLQKTKIVNKPPSFSLSALAEIKKTKIWLTPMGADNPKTYLENSSHFKQQNDLFEQAQGKFQGQIILSNGDKLRVKIRSKFRYQNSKYFGTSYVELTNSQKTFLISSNENGKNSNFRYEANDEVPILIIKVRPHHFLRLQYNQSSKSFSGHFYSLNPSNEFYKLIGEIKQLRQI